MQQTLKSQLNPPPAAPVKRKGSRILWWIVGGLASIAVLSGIACAIVIYVDAGLTARLITATTFALSLEGTVWTTAAAVGVTVFEARKRIWRFITFRGGAA